MEFEYALTQIRYGATVKRDCWQDGKEVFRADGAFFKIGGGDVMGEIGGFPKHSNSLLIRKDPYYGYMPYTPTTADLFADDWFVVEEADGDKA